MVVCHLLVDVGSSLAQSRSNCGRKPPNFGQIRPPTFDAIRGTSFVRQQVGNCFATFRKMWSSPGRRRATFPDVQRATFPQMSSGAAIAMQGVAGPCACRALARARIVCWVPLGDCSRALLETARIWPRRRRFEFDPKSFDFWRDLVRCWTKSSHCSPYPLSRAFWLGVGQCWAMLAGAGSNSAPCWAKPSTSLAQHVAHCWAMLANSGSNSANLGRMWSISGDFGADARALIFLDHNLWSGLDPNFDTPPRPTQTAPALARIHARRSARKSSLESASRSLRVRLLHRWKVQNRRSEPRPHKRCG